MKGRNLRAIYAVEVSGKSPKKGERRSEDNSNFKMYLWEREVGMRGIITNYISGRDSRLGARRPRTAIHHQLLIRFDLIHRYHGAVKLTNGDIWRSICQKLTPQAMQT